MQTLKPEIRARILENAEEMFFSLGFKGASTRELAKKVGVSYSNLYHYFETKNDLFAAVLEPYAAHFAATLARFLEHEENDVTAGQHVEAISQVFAQLIQSDRKKFVLLLDGSQDTRFAGVRQEVVATIEQRIEASLGDPPARTVRVIGILANHFLSALLEIARTAAADKSLQNDIRLLVLYHLGGIQELSRQR
jgi:AcrR family transcriptional regulator